MKTIIDINPKKVLAISNHIARRTNKEKFTQEDLVEKNDVFFIDVNINKTTVDKLPPSFQRIIFDVNDKDDIMSKLGEVGLSTRNKKNIIRNKNKRND